MPDENRFSGLGDVVEEEEPEAPVGESGESASAETSDDAGVTDEADALDDAASSGSPAFEFEDTSAKSVYVRPETLSVMDDAEFEVESLLRRDHEVRDLTGREFHDALVRVAADHPDEVVTAILAARDEE
ncbi:hypothetical protein SAMN04487947_4143 [Halogeometricum rufum]|uniref:Uncharacterized protein n=1 Tax=Halogeometricum rufum TaxID=553469 RepID=A0A1I6J744_9EURY|nr:hypothetical protein [Halogeometricum rufum]SFR74784.1 hypothetical protein SAMN04487947_4143 [Halogeometricum rufum]